MKKIEDFIEKTLMFSVLSMLLLVRDCPETKEYWIVAVILLNVVMIFTFKKALSLTALIAAAMLVAWCDPMITFMFVMGAELSVILVTVLSDEREVRKEKS